MSSSAPPSGSPARTAAERELLERAVHDLKNPLAVVRASLEWLEVELTGREEALDAVRDATSAADRLLTLVDDLDVLARLGEGGVASGGTAAIVPLVISVVSGASTRLARRGVTVEVKDPYTGRPLETTGDGRILARSLTALVDYTSRGAPIGACVEVRVAEAVSASGGREVEIGIALRGTVEAAPSELGFDRHERTNLGVYVARRVVEAHRGSIELVPTASLPRVVVRLPA